MNKEKINKILFNLLIFGLIVFLSLSAILVNLTNNIWLSLGRDIFIGLIFILIFFNRSQLTKIDLKIVFFLGALLLLYGLATFFWKEASFWQWVKGIRFFWGPMIIFLLMLNYQPLIQLKKINYLILSIGVVISLIAIGELFGLHLNFTQYEGAGALDSIHKVGNLDIIRVQSILSGPNALGLFMLICLSVTLGWLKKISRFWIILFVVFLAVLLATFSRSAFLGAVIVIMLDVFYTILNRKKNTFKAVGGVFLIIACAIGSLFILVKSDYRQELFLHGTSSQQRIEQYGRIWNSKYEIGLLGRGFGTAGPSSQFRLDGGENHFSENIYLDLFEEQGLIGLFIYLSFLVTILKYMLSRERLFNSDQLGAFYIFIGFAFSGLFINYYTGQVGIFLHWLILGLALSQITNQKSFN